MYTPAAFQERDPALIAALMSAGGLAQFITATAGGPLCTPLPLLYAPDEGEHGTLYGHLARANAQWREPALGPALAVFMGPDAYVSPAWYAEKAVSGRVVPTWNYLTVQAYGEVAFFDDATRLRDVVARLTDRHEVGRPAPWAVDDAPADYLAGQLRGIIGLRLPIARIAAKRKMSQNRDAGDRTRVRAELAAQGNAAAGLIPD